MVWKNDVGKRNKKRERERESETSIFAFDTRVQEATKDLLSRLRRVQFFLLFPFVFMSSSVSLVRSAPQYLFLCLPLDLSSQNDFQSIPAFAPLWSLLDFIRNWFLHNCDCCSVITARAAAANSNPQRPRVSSNQWVQENLSTILIIIRSGQRCEKNRFQYAFVIDSLNPVKCIRTNDGACSCWYYRIKGVVQTGLSVLWITKQTQAHIDRRR